MEVTARKWRPQNFEQFIGQEQIVEALTNALTTKNFGHAYLLSGPRGVGKTSCARVLAKGLNCYNQGPTAEPCGKCESCLEILSGNAVDVIEIDGASNNGVDKIREIRDNTQYLPSKSRFKIYIIDEVHMLTDAAFNALLKTLEEPPPHIIFIFATTEPHKVKITIRSRCQHYRFRRVPVSKIAEHLEFILKNYQFPYESEALRYIAQAADGSMRDAQSLLDQGIIYAGDKLTLQKVQEILGFIPEQQFLDFFSILISQDAARLEKFIQQLYFSGEDISFFVESLLAQLRLLLLAKHGLMLPEQVEEAHFQALRKLAPEFSAYQIHRLVELFLSLYKELKYSEDERFLMENYFYQALNYRNFINLPQLVSQLEALKQELLGMTGMVEEPLAFEQLSTPEKTERKAPHSKSAAGESFKTQDQEESFSGQIQESGEDLKRKQEEPFLLGQNPVDLKQEKQADKPEDLTPEQVWREFKGKVSERSPKLAAVFANVRQFAYETGKIMLEFISIYEEGLFQNDPQLIEKMKKYFAKFKVPVHVVETTVVKADKGRVANPVEFIKETFEGEEV